MACQSLKDIHDGTDRWKIRARVFRRWNVFTKSSPTDLLAISMVLIDEEGHKIQASVVNKKLHEVYRTTALEGHIYFIANFVVSTNMSHFRATNHRYKLTFTPQTYVSLTDAPIPTYSYSFFPLADVMKITELNHVDHLIDVIAYVKTIGNIEEYRRDNDIKTKLRLTLIDNDGNEVECVLFDECATNAYTRNLENMETPVVIVLNLARIGYSDDGSPNICNSYNATRVFFNLPIPEVKSFIESRKEGMSPVLTSTSYLIGSQSTQQSASSKMLKEKHIPISEITEQKIGDSFVIKCEIQKLETINGWLYDSCGKCSAKIKDENGKALCPVCKKEPDSVQPKLKLQYTVCDESGSASVLFWDRHAMQLIQKSAVDLKLILKEGKREYDVPDELDSVLGKKVLLKLKRNEYNARHPSASISVIHYVLCEDLMDQFMDDSQDDQHQGMKHSQQTEKDGSQEPDIPKKSSDACESQSPPCINLDKDKEDVLISQLSASTSGHSGKSKRKNSILTKTNPSKANVPLKVPKKEK